MNKSLKWDTSYEWKAVVILALGFGLVGLDRWIITPLFPVMMEDLNLSYQDLGNIVGILGLAWGISSLFAGRLADKFGRRKVLIPSIILFSLFSGFTGLAGGLISLLMIRVLMGATEGAFCPTSVAATADASKPSRRGFNMGFQQSMFALLGFGFAPIIATQLLQVVPSWHWVFVIMIIPGLILAWIMHRVIREPEHINGREKQESIQVDPPKNFRFMDVLRHRNIKLAILAICGTMTCIFILSAMMPNYLTDYLKLSVTQMGFVTSGIGFGAFLGQIAIPAISDKIGRKTAIMIALICAIGSLLILINLGSPTALFFVLFFTAFCANGCLCMFGGTVAIESVPVAMGSSAVGIVIGIGEIFGGGIAPSLGGYIAQNFGIEKTLFLALAGLIISTCVTLFIKETAPIKVNKLIVDSSDVKPADI